VLHRQAHRARHRATLNVRHNRRRRRRERSVARGVTSGYTAARLSGRAGDTQVPRAAQCGRRAVHMSACRRAALEGGDAAQSAAKDLGADALRCDADTRASECTRRDARRRNGR